MNGEGNNRVHRLSFTTEESIAAQVLYQMTLVTQSLQRRLLPGLKRREEMI